MEKPQCGSEAGTEEYDLPLHVAGVCKSQVSCYVFKVAN